MKKLFLLLLTLALLAAAGGTVSAQMTGMGAGAGMSPGDMMAMMGMMHPSVAVDNDFIYIVRGNQLIKMDKRSLEVVCNATLPPPPGAPPMGTMPPAGGAGGRGPAMQPMNMQSMITELQTIPASQFDRTFMQQMVSHHAGAIAMSRLALTKAVHPELRNFANKVIKDQSNEIARFNTWLGTWYGGSAEAVLMPIDQQRVNQLQNLNGRDFEIQYMRNVIMHHSDAVSMGQIAEKRATHADLRRASANIVKSQSKEIRQLSTWLRRWYGQS